jgi:type IV pilus assembly protein PilM
MDLRQEIKLSDLKKLLPGHSGSAAPRRRPARPAERPRYKELVGLKVGGSGVAAAHVSNNGSPRLMGVAREPLESGVVVGGELQRPGLLAETLRRLFDENELPRRAVRLGVATSRIGVRAFEIGGISDGEQLENAIRFRSQELLPISLDQAVLDWHVLREDEDERGNARRRILLVVANRGLVEDYLEACRAADVGLVGVDLEAFGLLRALVDPGKRVVDGEPAAFVGVALGHDRSTFGVSDGQVCEFARVLAWGGATLDAVIARERNVDLAEASRIKRSISLTDATLVPEGLSQDEAERVRDVVRREVYTFARELLSSLHFYQSQPGSLSVSEIILTGGTAQLPGLAAELERLVGVPVRPGDPLTRVEVEPTVDVRGLPASLAVPIGLAIED